MCAAIEKVRCCQGPRGSGHGVSREFAHTGRPPPRGVAAPCRPSSVAPPAMLGCPLSPGSRPDSSATAIIAIVGPAAVGRYCLPGGPGRRISSVFLRHATWHPLCAWHGVGSPSTVYQPRTPSQGVLYQVVRDHFETFRAQAAGLRNGEGLPRLVGVGATGRSPLQLSRGRLRQVSVRGLNRLVPLSCKGRAGCASGGPSTMLRAIPSKVEGWWASTCGPSSASCVTSPARPGWWMAGATRCPGGAAPPGGAGGV